MKIVICYVYPVFLPSYDDLAHRFVQSYIQYPPGETDHELHVYANGAQPSKKQMQIMTSLSPRWHVGGNLGKDIGAYQRAASEIECDLMLCLGTPVYFRQAGWLDWLVRIYEQNGPGLYGCWGFNEPNPHIRTTAFWLPPMIMASYPSFVSDKWRYEFEHGQHSILNWSKELGFPSYMVTWQGAFPQGQWHHVERKNCLMLDQHSDRINLQ